MKIEINLKSCKNCKHFVFLTEDEMSFLDEPLCGLNNVNVDDYEECDRFSIDKEVLNEIRKEYKAVNVRVVK